jgi:hypothetical protein
LILPLALIKSPVLYLSKNQKNPKEKNKDIFGLIDLLSYLLGTLFQSSKNFSIPLEVNGCVTIFLITGGGIVATSAPDFAASMT